MAHADVCAGLVDGQVQEARVLEVLGALAARLRGARLAYPAPRPRPATRLRAGCRTLPATLDHQIACRSSSKTQISSVADIQVHGLTDSNQIPSVDLGIKGCAACGQARTDHAAVWQTCGRFLSA